MSMVDSDHDGFIGAKEFNSFYNFCEQARSKLEMVLRLGRCN
jgi:hypothetical protein